MDLIEDYQEADESDKDWGHDPPLEGAVHVRGNILMKLTHPPDQSPRAYSVEYTRGSDTSSQSATF